MLSERERGEPGAGETKVITPGKIVPFKCCLPGPNISMKKDFDTDVFCKLMSHIFSYVNKQYLMDNAILRKMGGVYVTYMANVDKGQRHVVTLVWSFKI